MKNLYNKKIRQWWKKLKKTQINGILSHVHGSEELILLKYPYYSKPSIDSMSKFIFYRNRKNNPKICMEPQKTLISQLEEEEQS